MRFLVIEFDCFLNKVKKVGKECVRGSIINQVACLRIKITQNVDILARPTRRRYFRQKLYKRRGLLDKDFYKIKIQKSPMTQTKIVNFLFSDYKSMGTISCHSNQSSYPTGTKKNNYSFPQPIDAICEI